MKTLAKHFLPEIHLHVNPINRDIFLIVSAGLLVAVGILTMLVIAIS